jgi:membrane fusion protein (multidrug efflux system)
MPCIETSLNLRRANAWRLLLSIVLPSLLMLTACGPSTASDHSSASQASTNQSTKASPSNTNASKTVPANTAAASQAAPLPQVTVATMQMQSVTLSRQLPGRTHAYQTAEIRPQVSGIVTKRLFTEGSHVQAGQPLYQIDPAPFLAEVASSEAAIAKAQASIATSKARADRLGNLLQRQAVSAQDLDDANAAYLQAQAELAAAKARRQSANINLAYSTIKAPIDGIISRSSISAGALVNANQTQVLATISQLEPIYVDITQSSSEMLHIKQQIAKGLLQSDTSSNTVVALFLEDGSRYPHAGQLQFSEVTVDPATGSVTLRAKFPNPAAWLLPGMYVQTEFIEAVHPAAILVPQKAVMRNHQGQAVVWLVNASGVIETRIIETDRSYGAHWLVSSGLAAGDQVILEGLQKVRPGMQVMAVAAATTPVDTALTIHEAAPNTAPQMNATMTSNIAKSMVAGSTANTQGAR